MGFNKRFNSCGKNPKKKSKKSLGQKNEEKGVRKEGKGEKKKKKKK